MIIRNSGGDASRLEWVRSSYSDNGNSNECVEVAAAPGAVHVRDSKDLSVPELAFGETAWTGFVSYAAGR
ncbi:MULTISPECIES: DUF397 domain-containing protein [unclassified Streptomyces]|uniref:DUF397 domain-containing protein n=1 Tax=unclassified Streptomyces TaxID=2593676 RepID=UPI002ED418FE|nr:DUF397 domain-containing protein [Streptomyces sp. NBC_00891]WSY07193.1 DUF397 domain-containing protein [Streptomyces sp. NBC_00890]WSZ08820.1 DUF397 domain-containing protein [Streptomyces sp. NBC_00869]WSZ23682.1 DUF397 domain-containing protein [Streptomyces sp. NBC_00870]